VIGQAARRCDCRQFAGGVPIGRVSSVARGSKLFLEIRVTPSADFSRLTDVLLLAPSPAIKEGVEAGRSAAR